MEQEEEEKEQRIREEREGKESGQNIKRNAWRTHGQANKIYYEEARSHLRNKRHFTALLPNTHVIQYIEKIFIDEVKKTVAQSLLHDNMKLMCGCDLDSHDHS